MKDIAIYGAGGFGREIACLLNQINDVSPQWNLIGFFDDGVAPGIGSRYGKVLGNLHTLNQFTRPLSVVIAIATPKYLKKLSENITNPNIEFPNIIAPNVNIFDKSAFEIGRGNLIFFGCRLSCDVKIGNFNLFNGAVSLGHDVTMGDYNVLQPSVRISGDTIVGNENFFGVQSLVLQGLRVGNNTRIGVGSVVMRNTKDNFLYMGNPARKIII
jgi:sugar O-acyltransferase (sialic acid O-acetyltransferase NeuD family)